MPDGRLRATELDQQACIDEAVLKSLPDGCLFYPGCGRDWRHPFSLFRDHIKEFWFADINLVRQPDLLRQPPPLLRDFAGLHLFYRGVEDLGDQEVADPNDRGTMRHFLYTEKYREDDGRVVTVNRCHGFGQNALGELRGKLSVFFVRRCGVGEGNSAIWFDEPLGVRLIDAMLPGGLIVTDGAACGQDHSPYRAFNSDQKPDSVEAWKSKQPFSDDAGNQFRCVGYAGDGYGPTLAWRMTKSG